jgi:hypothetical protein
LVRIVKFVETVIIAVMQNLSQPPQLKLDATNLAAEWTQWLEDFELYSVGSGLNGKPAATQIAVFLHCIGPEARAKLKGFTLTDEQRQVLADIKAAFGAYCTPVVNEVIERYQFWSLLPGANEPIDAFVATLRSKALKCNFGDQVDRMIRDRIVFTCVDRRTKEALIRTEDLDLTKAVRVCRAAEAARDSMRELGSSSVLSDPSVAAIVSHQSSSSRMIASRDTHKSRAERSSTPSTLPRGRQPGTCRNCASIHPPRQCPAYGRTCHACGRANHYSSCCLSKDGGSRRGRSRRRRSRSRQSAAAHSVDAAADDIDNILHIGELVTVNTVASLNSIYRDLSINDTTLSCKVDTGAQVNVMSLAMFNSLCRRPALKPTRLRVKPFGTKKSLTPCGTAALSVFYNGRRLEADFLVLDTPDPALLGLEACLQLGIIKLDDAESPSVAVRPPSVHAAAAEATDDRTKAAVVAAMSSSSPPVTSQLIDEFADVFEGLGCILGEYDITVDESVPPVIQPTRRVPLHLRPKLQQLLNDMERRGIIMKRTEPTDWCNALVIVEKKNVKLRACIDPVPLNRVVKRERYSIPTFDDVVAEMHGKKLFTLIDMRDGYWQIRLADKSSHLCTFGTPFSGYSYLRLPMGVSCSNEVFQRKNVEMFGDIPNIHIIHDDIIIAAADEAEHDAALRELLVRARRLNVRLNKDKMRLKQTSTKYFGNVLSSQGWQIDEDKVRAIKDMPEPKDKKSLMRFIGMVTFLARWIPHLTDIKRPLCQLLHDDVEWQWFNVHRKAVQQIKSLLITAP